MTVTPHKNWECQRREGASGGKGQREQHAGGCCSCRHVNRLTFAAGLLHDQQQSSVPLGAPPSPPGVLAAVQSPSPPVSEWLPLAPHHGPPLVTEGKFPAHCNVLCTLVAEVEETRGRGGEELVREKVEGGRISWSMLAEWRWGGVR